MGGMFGLLFSSFILWLGQFETKNERHLERFLLSGSFYEHSNDCVYWNAKYISYFGFGVVNKNDDKCSIRIKAYQNGIKQISIYGILIGFKVNVRIRRIGG